MARPLHGVRVLDFSRYVSGPHCTRMLADFGADVVKVEPPGGDGTRRWGRERNGLGPFFSQQNCGKRSISVDLANDDAVELCRRLAAAADVVVENFRPGVMDRLGLGAELLRKNNPRLIYATITGFGRTGSLSDRRAYANVVHASAGLLERAARTDGRDPTPVRWSAADTTSSLQLLVGILAALYRRERSGDGDTVEVAMIDAVLSADDFAAFDLWDPDPSAPRPDPVLCAAADGHVMISANPVYDPEPFCTAMGRPELLDDPRFAGRHERRANRAAFIAELEAWATTLPADLVERRLHDAGLAVSKLRSTREAVEWGRDEPRPVIVDVDDRAGEPAPLINSPQRFAGAESGITGVVPYRGEHNEAVLRDWLHLAEPDIERLVSTGALSPPEC
jgi:crotonobetainyl-CoA:carnitine CoA-transferase CaiB-like acyl-CoA transferase